MTYDDVRSDPSCERRKERTEQDYTTFEKCSMASDVRARQTSSHYPRGTNTISGGNNRSTANLVRLLREAEQGNGLECDYGEALDEALVEKDFDGADHYSKRNGKTLLLGGRRRCCRGAVRGWYRGLAGPPLVVLPPFRSRATFP